MSPHAPPDELPSWFIVKATVLASLGGCLFGYDLGAISGALPQLQASFDLTDAQQEWIVSILYLGGGLGASVGGTLCDWVGRQRTILGTDVVFMIGAAWLYWANSYTHVLLGRFVVGIAVAVSGVADVSYLHEIAPLEWRGAIVSVNEACISLGFLLAYMAGYFYSSSEDEEWRIIFGWAGVLALVQLVGMWRMPESPVWLAEQGCMEDSRRAWQQINGGGIVQEDSSLHPSTTEQRLEGLDEGPGEETLDTGEAYQHKETEREDSLSSIGSYPMGQLSGWFRWMQFQLQGLLITLSRHRRQVYIALFLATTQQLGGQTNVLSYAPSIFSKAAGEEESPGWLTLTIGVVKFLVTVLVIWRIEFVGRRTLLLFGMSLISLGLLFLIVAFTGSDSDDPDSWYNNLKTFKLALPGVLLVVTGYSMSFGPLTWLLTSELFPTEIRGRALGASTIITYLCAALVTRTFLSAQSALGPSSVFGIYCIINTVGIVFAYLAIPDTGEKTVEQIEEALQRMWWWRNDAVALSQMEEEESSSARSPTSASAADLHIRRESSDVELTSSSDQNLRELT
jgi:MFS family permease